MRISGKGGDIGGCEYTLERRYDDGFLCEDFLKKILYFDVYVEEIDALKMGSSFTFLDMVMFVVSGGCSRIEVWEWSPEDSK